VPGHRERRRPARGQAEGVRGVAEGPRRRRRGQDGVQGVPRRGAVRAGQGPGAVRRRARLRLRLTNSMIRAQ
jgi:hypothetical protein